MRNFARFEVCLPDALLTDQLCLWEGGADGNLIQGPFGLATRNRAMHVHLQTHWAFPDAERFGLTSQMRRASVSIASNIAEGYGRSTRGEYLQFLGHARGSICELQTQLVIARKLQFGASNEHDSADSISADVSRLLIALMNKLRK